METSFERFLTAFDESIRWAEGLGLRVRIGRFGDYRRFYRELLRAAGQNTTVLLHERWAQEALAGLVAGQELILIRGQLSGLPSKQLLPRLKKFVAGAALEAAENPATRTSEARDFGFELVLAARFAAGGLDPELPAHGDISINAAGTPVHVECKRPQSIAGLEEAIGTAAEQLRVRAERTHASAPRGVIGVSIGKLVHQGTHLVVATTPAAARKVLDDRAVAFVRANERLWQRPDWACVHLVIIDISAPVHVPKTEQWLWGHWGILNPKWGVLTGEPWLQRLHVALNASRGVHGF